MFQELFPIVTTAAIDRALAFYRELLGFEVTYRFPPDGTPEYVGMHLGSSQLGIAVAPDGGGQPQSERSPAEGAAATITFWVYAEDCDAAVERLREHGVAILEEPRDQPWGERIAAVADPDGNTIIIGSRAEG